MLGTAHRHHQTSLIQMVLHGYSKIICMQKSPSLNLIVCPKLETKDSSQETLNWHIRLPKAGIENSPQNSYLLHC
jgi:hypothetical protein